MSGTIGSPSSITSVPSFTVSPSFAPPPTTCPLQLHLCVSQTCSPPSFRPPSGSQLPLASPVRLQLLSAAALDGNIISNSPHPPHCQRQPEAELLTFMLLAAVPITRLQRRIFVALPARTEVAPELSAVVKTSKICSLCGC